MPEAADEFLLRNKRFQDRFDPATYRDDEPVGLYVGSDYDGGLYVPERIFGRLVSVGRAYALHTLPLIGGIDAVTLRRHQLEVLLDEVAFVAESLPNDRLVADVASQISNYVAGVLRQPGEVELTVEGNN